MPKSTHLCRAFRAKRPYICLAAIAATLCSAPSFAAVNQCEALTLYGNAYGTACTDLGPVNGNNGMMVCQLAGPPADREVHTTFSAGPRASNPPSPLHITVRSTGGAACEAHTLLGGGWTAPGLNIAPANQQPHGWTVGPVACGATLANYVVALNNVPRAHGCIEAFTEAQGHGLEPGIANSYIAMCKSLRCP